MNKAEKYLLTGERLAKFVDSAPKETGDRTIARVVMSLLDNCHHELAEEQREDLALARMYWNKTIDRIPRKFFERASARIQNDDRSGAEHSKQAWLNRLILAAFELEKNHHSNSIERVIGYALTFEIDITVLEAAITRNIDDAEHDPPGQTVSKSFS
ncbi:MAG: hypothetical protein AB8G18_15650 [Gammaproteobacteria bacterium]